MAAVAQVLGSTAKNSGKQVASLARSSAGKVMNLAHRHHGANPSDTTYPFEVPARVGQVSNSGFMWPAYGTVSRGFSAKANHKGIDVLAPTGTPVYAARNGKVLYSGRKFSGFGNVIILDHGGGLATIYAHNHRNLVKEDEIVRCGQQIAEVGDTGRATAPHCHFEIRQDGEPLDPRPMLP